ncbi:MAG: hypothetical protein FWH43_04990 [Endomicrobia bacterium]|nr:hypothetical protein [Endomicrobiia bacterium]
MNELETSKKSENKKSPFAKHVIVIIAALFFLVIAYMPKIINKVKNDGVEIQNNKKDMLRLKLIDELSEDYAAGKIEKPEYVALLQKHAEKAGKEINHKRASQELQKFILDFRHELTYQEYKKFLEDTDNLTNDDKIYSNLINFIRNANIYISKNYPELKKTLDHFELTQKIKNLNEISSAAENKNEAPEEAAEGYKEIIES